MASTALPLSKMRVQASRTATNWGCRIDPQQIGRTLYPNRPKPTQPSLSSQTQALQHYAKLFIIKCKLYNNIVIIHSSNIYI